MRGQRREVVGVRRNFLRTGLTVQSKEVGGPKEEAAGLSFTAWSCPSYRSAGLNGESRPIISAIRACCLPSFASENCDANHLQRCRNPPVGGSGNGSRADLCGPRAGPRDAGSIPYLHLLAGAIEPWAARREQGLARKVHVCKRCGEEKGGPTKARAACQLPAPDASSLCRVPRSTFSFATIFGGTGAESLSS